jgi:hypothetical protein
MKYNSDAYLSIICKWAEKARVVRGIRSAIDELPFTNAPLPVTLFSVDR